MVDTMIKEKPILFKAEMVRAILDGRKTQTRRVIKPQPTGEFGWCHDGDNPIKPKHEVEDRLWVRETWHTDTRDLEQAQAQHEDFMSPSPIYYKESEVGKLEAGYVWKSPIFMPKWASRLWLEVVDVRAERVQDLSEADAKAEGCASTAVLNEAKDDYTGSYSTENFWRLWDSINEKKGFGWKENPFVWVYTFKVLSIAGRP